MLRNMCRNTSRTEQIKPYDEYFPTLLHIKHVRHKLQVHAHIKALSILLSWQSVIGRLCRSIAAVRPAALYFRMGSDVTIKIEDPDVTLLYKLMGSQSKNSLRNWRSLIDEF